MVRVARLGQDLPRCALITNDGPRTTGFDCTLFASLLGHKEVGGAGLHGKGAEWVGIHQSVPAVLSRVHRPTAVTETWHALQFHFSY